MQLIETAMLRSRTVVMSLAVIIVAGVMTYMSVPKEAEPDINIPMIYVSMVHDGISPGRCRETTGPADGTGDPHNRRY